MNMFTIIKNDRLDRDYYATLAMDFLGTFLSSRYSFEQLVSIGRDLDEEQVNAIKFELKVS